MNLTLLKGNKASNDQPIDDASDKNERNFENPYVAARNAWNSNVDAINSVKNVWQTIAIVSMVIALLAVVGIIYIGSQSKYIPYIVEVDALGNTVTAGPVTTMPNVDSRIVKSTVANFISDSRLVTPDITLQRAAILRVYSHLSPSDPATNKMSYWFNGTPESNKFKQAEKQMVNVEIKSILPQSADTWQVDWTEFMRDRSGALITDPVNMRALVTVYTAEMGLGATEEDIEEEMRMNPLGIYIQDFSWSKLL